MASDVEEERSVSSCVEQLTLGWLAEWKAAENERPGIVRHVLGASVSLLAYELDSFELPEPPFRDPQLGESGPKRVKGDTRKGGGSASSIRPSVAFRGAVRKLRQKCMKLTEKGFHFERKQMSPN